MSVIARMAVLINLMILIALSTVALADSADAEVEKLRQGWAAAKYQTAKDHQLSTYEKLVEEAKQAAEKYPRNPQIMVWYGTILSSYSANKGGIGVLPHIKKSRELLEEAIQIDPHVENGFAEAVLGALYARAPSWPIAFGSKQKARLHLEKAIQIDPKGIDTNYYFGDFLVDVGDYKDARAHLEIAKNAPIRPDHEVQDRGRKSEVSASLARINRSGR